MTNWRSIAVTHYVDRIDRVDDEIDIIAELLQEREALNAHIAELKESLRGIVHFGRGFSFRRAQTALNRTPAQSLEAFERWVLEEAVERLNATIEPEIGLWCEVSATIMGRYA